MVLWYFEHQTAAVENQYMVKLEEYFYARGETNFFFFVMSRKISTPSLMILVSRLFFFTTEVCLVSERALHQDGEGLKFLKFGSFKCVCVCMWGGGAGEEGFRGLSTNANVLVLIFLFFTNLLEQPDFVFLCTVFFLVFFQSEMLSGTHFFLTNSQNF